MVRALSLATDSDIKGLRTGLIGDLLGCSLSHNGTLGKIAPRCLGGWKGLNSTNQQYLVFSFYSLIQTSSEQL